MIGEFSCIISPHKLQIMTNCRRDRAREWERERERERQRERERTHQNDIVHWVFRQARRLEWPNYCPLSHSRAGVANSRQYPSRTENVDIVHFWMHNTALECFFLACWGCFRKSSWVRNFNPSGCRLFLRRVGPPPKPISKMVLNHLNRWVYDACKVFFEKKYFWRLQG